MGTLTKTPMRNILLPLLLFFQAVQSQRWGTGIGTSWSERSGDDGKPSWAESKSFWKEKLFNWLQRAKSGNTWKTWNEQSWVKRPETKEKPNWSEQKRWTMEKREKPG